MVCGNLRTLVQAETFMRRAGIYYIDANANNSSALLPRVFLVICGQCLHVTMLANNLHGRCIVVLKIRASHHEWQA